MNILQLKSLWSSEKEAFKEKELGALQNFVKKVLECIELFNLEEGKESTAPHDRKNVFIQEDTDSKARNRPDFVLYLEIDQTQIKIPVEVERHENIKAGEKQIKDYKEIYNAVYAILTDGNEWHFYEGDTVHKILRLDEILDEPGIFQTFWKEYTLPETYYISFFERMGSKSLFDKEGLEVEENRETFFDDITKLIRAFKYKLQLAHYFVKEKDPDRVATEISYAYVIQYILYKTLVDNDYSNKKEEFLGRFKEVHKSLKGKVFGEVLTQATHIADYISENLYRPFSAEQKYIEEKLNEIKRQTKKSISDISAWLDIFIFIKKYNFVSVKNELFGYIYENYLKELYEDENKGQYFTDPAVVEFMLDEIGYTTSEIKKRIKVKPDNPDISIIDPACGSGTFLYSAAKRIIDAVHRGDEETAKRAENLISENVFGLDIAVFPLYLAEMGILMKMLTLIANEKYNNPMEKKIKLFKTEDSISEFIDIKEFIQLKSAKQKGFADIHYEFKFDVKSMFMRDEKDLEEMKNSMRPPRRRFDFVIGNPPYISYNESCRQGIAFTEMIKQKKLSMADIYGVNLNTAGGRIKTYPPKPNLYAFFIALGLSLLKEKGRICFIIPQTILNSADHDVLRYHFAKNTSIEKFTTFAGRMFIGRGLKQKRPVPTSSLIFIINNYEAKNKDVELVNYEKSNVNDFQNFFYKTKKSETKISQTYLYDNWDNWNFITKPRTQIGFAHKYLENSESFDVYRLFENSVPRYKDKFYFDVGFILDKKLYTKKYVEGYYSVLDFKNAIHYKTFKPTYYYPNDPEKIELTRSNQGHITLSPKYKLVWRIKNPDHVFFIDSPIIFNMGTASIITSDNKLEMLYLLSLLNSKVSSMILDTYLRIPSEKEYIMAILPIKRYIRVPKITETNGFIKGEIIKRTEEMLDLEDCQLQDLVDFSNTTKQKFDSVEIKGNNLVLTQNGQEYKAPIKIKKDVVNVVLKEQYGDKGLLPGEIALSELKYLLALDKELQKSLKDYIDDLVFALYFSIPVKKIGLNLASQIKELCRQNGFYDYIEKEMRND
jgi:hypothetical protein